MSKSGFTHDDLRKLHPAARAEAERQLRGMRPAQAIPRPAGAVAVVDIDESPSPRTPNATETAALAVLPEGAYHYEAITFGICGGATYRPDWTDGVRRIAIEVKGEYIHSRDSRRSFNEAKHLHPEWTWIWARLRTKGRKGRRWEIEVYADATREARR